MTYTFLEYVENKDREGREHLDIIKQILANGGFKVIDETKRQRDPFIYVYAPENNLSFEGIRVYSLAPNITSYRIQSKLDTAPYGKAYLIDVNSMFESLLGDHQKDKELGKEIAKAIVEEVKLFFKRSYEAERGLDTVKYDPLNSIAQRAGGFNSYGSNMMSTSDDRSVGGTGSGL